MKENQFAIHNNPKGQELCRSISGNFQRFPEIINKFVDDALSNFQATRPEQRRVEIRLRQWEDLWMSRWWTWALASGTSTPPSSWAAARAARRP